MAPTDFYQFPKLKYHLRGTKCESNEGVIEAVNEYLWDQEKAFYVEGIRKLEQRIEEILYIRVMVKFSFPGSTK